MPTHIQCFFLEPSTRAQQMLRRFCWADQGTKCTAPWGYHNAENVLEDIDFPLEGDPTYRGLDGYATLGDPFDRQDPKWPTSCPCGYLFEPTDQWQYDVTRKYRQLPSGDLYTHKDAPVGSIWYADWMTSTHHYNSGPDGHCLVVKTPGGEWVVDGPSSNNQPGWTRTGEPPLVTARPSILFPSSTPIYHGFLTDGWLIEC